MIKSGKLDAFALCLLLMFGLSLGGLLVLAIIVVVRRAASRGARRGVTREQSRPRQG